MNIKFSIPGEPKGKDRPRFRVINAGDKQFVSVYTSKQTKMNETYIKAASMEYKPEKPYDGPIAMNIKLKRNNYLKSYKIKVTQN